MLTAAARQFETHTCWSQQQGSTTLCLCIPAACPCAVVVKFTSLMQELLLLLCGYGSRLSMAGGCHAAACMHRITTPTPHAAAQQQLEQHCCTCLLPCIPFWPCSA